MLTEHAEQAYPLECCGVLLGRRDHHRRTVVDAMRCRNAHPDPAHHYVINPAELIACQKTARERGFEIIGFYHSHPDRTAECSPTDRAEAYWAGCSYVILGVQQGRVDIVRSYELLHEPNRLEDEPVLVSQTTHPAHDEENR